MSQLSRLARRIVAIGAIAVALLTVGLASPAAACGGLIGENGSIKLERTTTLAAWHDGVEHYVTSFAFSGSGKSVGSIIPLPAVPTAVEAAGQWTLQRLQREVAPPRRDPLDTAARSVAADAEVLLTTQVDALDITVLKGGGDSVGKWALDNGFFLTPDAPEVLDFYAARSQIFLAAKFDASRAAAQRLNGGDGTPIDITMPLDHPWVPLRILGLGLPSDTQVDADVFLLTDDTPTLLTGGGVTVERTQPASRSLMSDLRSDRGMEWMPEHMWFSHLVVDDSAGDLRYDLSVGTASVQASYAAAGLPAALGAFDGTTDGRAALVAATLGALFAGALVVRLSLRRRARS
ncbi:MAG: DUF2330 domain-containing protein [Acidimicrobiales bacterium]